MNWPFPECSLPAPLCASIIIVPARVKHLYRSPPTLWRSRLRASTKSHSCSSSICTAASSWANLKLSVRVRPAWKATLALFNRSLHSRGYVFKQGSPSLVLKPQQHQPAEVRRAHPHIDIPSPTLPSARDAAVPLTSTASLRLDTHVNTGQEASTNPALPFSSPRRQWAAEFIQSQSPTGFNCGENPIHCSQSGDKLRVKGLSQIILNPVTPDKRVSSTIKPLKKKIQAHKSYQDRESLCCQQCFLFLFFK